MMRAIGTPVSRLVERRNMSSSGRMLKEKGALGAVIKNLEVLKNLTYLTPPTYILIGEQLGNEPRTYYEKGERDDPQHQ
jgi:hypothetical protein